MVNADYCTNSIINEIQLVSPDGELYLLGASKFLPIFQ